MAEYPRIVLTNAGFDMIAESQTGRSLIFTKLQIGDGLQGEGESISTFTGLKSRKLDIPIQGFLNQGNGQVRLRYLVDNSGVPVNQGFFAREVGVFAKLDAAGTEQLYAYTNGGNKVDWIPDKNTPMDAQIYDIFVLIGNASNVTIVMGGSATYATVLDLAEHNSDSNAHTGLFLPIAGGTMAGPLSLVADPTTDMQAATKQYADNNGGVNLRKNSHVYAVGDICYSKTAASYKYMQCQVSGTTAAAEPASWPDVGMTVTDGTVTWLVRDIRAGEQIGSIKAWLANAAPPGWLALDTGALVSRATYPQLWAWVQANAPLITEAAWQAQAAAQTSVGAYSSGDGATTFRLPRILDYPRGGTSAEVGSWQGDAIRNITGSFQPRVYSNYAEAFSSGGFAGGSNSLNQASTAGNIEGTATINFDASRVVPTAAENRPKTIKFLYCVKAFDAQVNQGLIDITELANEMASKVNQTDFSGILATNGYQKLPNGLIIQWGTVTISSGTSGAIFTLPIAFPHACLHAIVSDTGSTCYAFGAGNFTKNDLTIWRTPTNGAATAQYIAIGF